MFDEDDEIYDPEKLLEEEEDKDDDKDNEDEKEEFETK